MAWLPQDRSHGEGHPQPARLPMVLGAAGCPGGEKPCPPGPPACPHPHQLGPSSSCCDAPQNQAWGLSGLGSSLSQPMCVMSLEDSAPVRCWLSEKGKPAAAQWKMLAPWGLCLGGSLCHSGWGFSSVWQGVCRHSLTLQTGAQQVAASRVMGQQIGGQRGGGWCFGGWWGAGWASGRGGGVATSADATPAFCLQVRASWGGGGTQ